MFALAGVLAVVLIATHLPPLWRLLLFPLLAGGAAGVFQWREKT
jgi:hypothetical protein